MDRPNRHHVSPAIRLWVSIARTYRQTYRRHARVLADHGLTVAQFDVLATLLRAPECGMRMGELSAHLLVTEGNVTGLVRRMAEAGRVRRDPDPEDARAARVRLTEEGRRTAERVIPAVEAELERAFSGLTGEETGRTLRLLRRARRSVAVGAAGLDGRTP